jgi:ketosteroid isomerase-like protein
MVTALVLALSLAASSTQPQTAEVEVRRALADVVDAFNNLDWDRLRVWIDRDATLFNPEIPEAPPSLGRIDGKDAVEQTLRSVFDASRKGPGPPYLHLVPQNVRVQMFEPVAVATFEFDRGKGSIGRRTFVFRKGPEGWRIVHIHASNTKPKE